MLQTQSECSCDYYNVYSLQFFKSLGQLTAGLLSTAVVVPMYTYYSRNYLGYKEKEEYQEYHEDNKEHSESDDSESEDIEDIEDIEDLRVESNDKREETLKELGYTNIN